MSNPSGPSSTPAGWYPDPDQPGSQRYWDGTQWTEHRAPSGPAVTATAPTSVLPSVNTAATKGGVPKWVLVVGGVLGALVLIGMIGAAMGGNKSGSNSSSGTPASPAATAPGTEAEAPTEAPAEPVDEPETQAPEGAGIGAPVRDGKFEFVVQGVKCGVTRVGTKILGTDPQGQFCIVGLTVTNIGDEGQTFDAVAQNAYNSAGQKYEADSEASLYSNENTESFLENINPGNTLTVNIAFDIPKDASLAKLELHDSLFSGGVDVNVG